ncbi:MAG: hypothetical protein CMA03_03980 [Euryarchaeota archaeon]|nr:hypothetical protein [Euryarchaeota archaeon]|tara:strand:+ start:1616 stop:1858 length:243 start_codon:yes stop_codon:yes gene_type:complete
MGGGSAPEVKLPDVGLVFGISLLLGYILMTIKSGSNFSENLISNLFMILLGIGLTVYGVYYGIIYENSHEQEILDAELIK